VDIYKIYGFWNAVVSENAKNDYFIWNNAVSTEKNYNADALISVFVKSVTRAKS